MPYILYKSNGQKLATIQDGSIDKTTTDLTFVGKNYAGYGETLNQNLVKLLENFADTTEPSLPMVGQLWYNSSTKKLTIYNGTRFKAITNFDTGTSLPKDNSKGDLFFNESQQKLYFYNGSKFVLIGPYESDFNGSALVPTLSVGDDDLEKYTLKFTIDDGTGPIVVGAVARDNFVPNAVDSLATIDGFNVIRKGISLPGTTLQTGDSTGDGYYFWGTAGTSLGMVEITPGQPSVYYAAGEYALKTYIDGKIANGLNIPNDAGITVGFSNPTVQLHSSGGNEGKLSVIGSNNGTLSINLNMTDATTVLTEVMHFYRNTIIPNTNIGVNLGSPVSQFSNMWVNTLTTRLSYANTFTGNLIGNVTGNLKGLTTGTHTGPVIGNVTGNTVGEHTGPVTGNLTSGLLQAVGGLSSSQGTIRGEWTLESGSTLNGNISGTITGDTLGTHKGNVLSSVITGTNIYGTTANITNIISSGGYTGDVITSMIMALGGSVGSTAQIKGQWTLVAGSTLQSTYADLAERYHADAIYEPGTVVILGGDAEITVTSIRADTSVAGIISSNPAYTLNSEAGSNETHPYIALTGRVPCKVVGKIRKGDLLVTSSATGRAETMRSTDSPNAVIGKALADFDGPFGVIEVKV
jgi:hypothetical protein